MSCCKPRESPLAQPPTLSPRPHPVPPSFLMKRILFRNLRAILLPPPHSQHLENFLPPQPPTPRTCPHMGSRRRAMLRPLRKLRNPLSLSKPPTSDDALPYVLIRGKRVEVPEAYPKGAEGRLVNDQRFLQELEQFLAKDICDACARNSNPRAKPKPSDTKTALIYKRVFADFLYLAPRHLWSHAKNVVGPR